MSDDLKNFLAHYGVKGMKWGIRKDRGPKGQARREAKAQKQDAKARNLQSQIRKTNSVKGRSGLSQGIANMKVSELKRRKAQAEKDAQARREGRLTRGQKRMVVGATAVAATIAAYGLYKGADSGEFSRLAQKGKSMIEGSGGAPQWKKKDMLSGKDWDADALETIVVSKINPDFGAIGTNSNCRRATFAYEMRRRGYDVKATRTVGATGQNSSGLFNVLNPGEKNVGSSTVSRLTRVVRETVGETQGRATPFTDISTSGALGRTRLKPDENTGYATSIFKNLSSQPNGARGELGMSWKMGGGHSMAWEIVKGKPVIFDAQTGRRYSSPGEISKLANSMKGAGVTRLDNVELDQDFLMRWLRDA